MLDRSDVSKMVRLRWVEWCFGFKVEARMRSMVDVRVLELKNDRRLSDQRATQTFVRMCLRQRRRIVPQKDGFARNENEKNACSEQSRQRVLAEKENCGNVDRPEKRTGRSEAQAKAKAAGLDQMQLSL